MQSLIDFHEKIQKIWTDVILDHLSELKSGPSQAPKMGDNQRWSEIKYKQTRIYYFRGKKDNTEEGF